MTAAARPRHAAPAPAPPAVERGAVVVSVIIVNWNVRDLLLSCLRSLRDELRLRPGQVEVVVVDNASSDGSVEAVRAAFPEVRVVASDENLGFGRANDLVLPSCRGRYVLLLNPDTVVLDGAVDRMVAHLEARPDVAALACRLLNSDGTFQRWTAGHFPTVRRAAVHAFFLDRVLPPRWRPRSLYLGDDVPHDLDVDWVSGACMLLRREALGDRIFDEAYFMYGEDTDLCDRLHRAGWRVVYSPCATVVHHAGRSIGQQQGPVLLTSFKGPRQFYRMRHGAATVWAYDLMIATGFLLRAGAYLALAVARPGGGHRRRAAHCWTYATRALQVLVGR
jgi:GT2 family glycosyltransferase